MWQDVVCQYTLSTPCQRLGTDPVGPYLLLGAAAGAAAGAGAAAEGLAACSGC